MHDHSFPISIVMDVPFSKMSLKETNEYLTDRIEKKLVTHVVTANPEIVMYANESLEYKKVLHESDIIVPDGIGIVYASKLRNNPVTERVAGYDLLHSLMAKANERGWSVYLLGANEEINRLAFERLAKDYPNAKLVGRNHGYFSDNTTEEREVIEEIQNLQPELLFVALGFPKQELWISRNKNKLNSTFLMGVGGSLDVLSGKVKRAPKLWQKLGIEWLYRLISTPSRWRRMLVLPVFLLKELKFSILKK